jgi:hypothetical protein
MRTSAGPIYDRRRKQYVSVPRAVRLERTAAQMMARAHGNTLRAINKRLNKCQE